MKDAHEAAGALLAAHTHLRCADEMLHEARGLGRWDDFAAGDSTARNALRDIRKPLARMCDRLEKLVHAAAVVPAGGRLTLEKRGKEVVAN